MPLLDHFCPPLATERHWESFYLSWAVQIATYLNRLLPDDYRATPHICFGIDLDEEETLPQGWQPSAPDQWLPFSTITQSAEVLIHSSLTNPSLVGAVGFVCKANKAHPIERQALVAKWETYLRQGAGLVVIDIVTSYQANLHHELLVRLGETATTQGQPALYTTAYRPYQQVEQIKLALWQKSLVVGHSLPTLPLWLRHEFCAPLDLEATYVETCHGLRIPVS